MMLITISLVLSLFQQSLASTAFCQNKDYESGALGDFPSQLYNAAPFHPVQLNYALPPAKCPSNDDIDGYFFLSPGSIDTLQEDTSIINADGTLVGSIPGLFMGMHKYNGTNHIATWTGTHEPVNNAYGSGYITLLDDTYSMVANFTTVNLGVGADIHEVEITSSSTAIMVAYLPRRTDLQAYGGPMNGYLADSIVQEVDIATGRLSFSWNALEHVDPSESYAAFGSTGNGSVEYPWDYFHINSVQKQPDGNYLISSRHCQAVYLIDPSGTIIWRMGGKKSDFVFPQGLEFSWQHHARIHNRSTLSLFNNGASEWQEDLPFAQGLLLKFDYSNTNKEVSAINARNPFSPSHRCSGDPSNS
ncbi:hypothetical protein D9757_001485 [Collybiopsis confluens]|uniref:ASST-domain-containing protein n=1 Tax=Collybiopsis confluens TaxID=2823264 RepID=A0A8H5HZB3_9AGAR|nr:hypothetical protein D9757_001485 [Collybiopsis confluens]